MGDQFKNLSKAKVTLIKSAGGVFEITVNDALVYSKKATGRFPSDAEVEAMQTA